MVTWNRRAAIVGIGRTHASARRPDVNQLEMVNEAVREALQDAGLTPKDIDCNVLGDMELFQGDYQSDMWHVDGYGGRLGSGFRITSGGSTGLTIAASATNLVASGLYDIVIAIGFQKHDEGNATTGLCSVIDPLWPAWFNAGVSGGTAQEMVKEYGTGVEETAARVRVNAADNASRNPYAHLRQKLTMEDVMKSPYIVYPMRMLHLCPQSTAACAVIFACEEKAKKITKNPVWVKDHQTCHKEGLDGAAYMLPSEFGGKGSAWRKAAEVLYKRNGITDPLKQIDLIEMYDPTVWFHMEFLQHFLMVDAKELHKMINRGDTARDGRIPVCPSGGVVTTNPIGATALLRVAEAALQIRGDCGDYQVEKDVHTALSSGFGGSYWTGLMLLTKNLK
jgi:acetyl-CoA C-acetyltransferase